MITFKQFITENDDFDLEKFKTDCDFFLSNMKGPSSLLWRGIQNPPKDYAILPFTERTKTLDTPPHVHAFLNSYYREKIGYPIRNWLFTTGSKREADQYTDSRGGPSVVFPTGNFSWFCFKDKELKDLWLYINRLSDDINKVFTDEKEATFQLYDSLETVLDAREFWFNEDLKACIESGNEIMIKCDRYYLFNPDNIAFNEYVLPYLYDEGKISPNARIYARI